MIEVVWEYISLVLLDGGELGMGGRAVVQGLKMRWGLNSKEYFISAQKPMLDPGGNGKILEAEGL